MRVLVTGSRDWRDLATIDAVLCVCAVASRSPLLVVHGAASGADTCADQIARRYGWTVERHPAQWRDLGKRAGMTRNQQMVDLGADVCLAFIRNRSAGATHCANAAERAGIATIRFAA